MTFFQSDEPVLDGYGPGLQKATLESDNHRGVGQFSVLY